MMEDKGLQRVTDVVVGLNDCLLNVLAANDIVDETKHLMDFATSKQWIKTAETGTRQELIDTLGAGIDPMT